jgi:hypothetical protein
VEGGIVEPAGGGEFEEVADVFGGPGGFEGDFEGAEGGFEFDGAGEFGGGGGEEGFDLFGFDGDGEDFDGLVVRLSGPAADWEIFSTTSMPSVTWPKAENLLSRAVWGPMQTKNWAPPELGLPGMRTVETVPRSCLRSENSSGRRLRPPVPQRLRGVLGDLRRGSPPWMMP